MASPWSNQVVSLIILTEATTGFSGIFGYSPSPGAGTLIFSLAAAAGTDPYGNPYPQGLSTTLGSISGVVFNGTDFFINNSGAFFYSGTPAAGNLIASITNGTGTDAQGNAFLSGFTTYGFGGLFFTAVSVDEGTISWYQSTTEAGPWTIFTDIGFAWDSLLGGSMSLQAANQVTFGNTGNASWNDNTQVFTAPTGTITTLDTTTLTVNGSTLSIPQAEPAKPASALGTYSQTWTQNNVVGILDTIIDRLHAIGVW